MHRGTKALSPKQSSHSNARISTEGLDMPDQALRFAMGVWRFEHSLVDLDSGTLTQMGNVI